LLKIKIKTDAYPKAIHGAIHKVITRDIHGKPPFTLYCDGLSTAEITFLDNDIGLEVLDAIYAKKFIVNGQLVKESMLYDIGSLSKFASEVKPSAVKRLYFLSPTSFRQRDKYLWYPDPANVFKKAATLINKPVPADLRLANYKIKRQPITISADLPKMIGFVGFADFECLSDKMFLPVACKVLEYTGAGWKTALGMGKISQIRPVLEQENNLREKAI